MNDGDRYVEAMQRAEDSFRAAVNARVLEAKSKPQRPKPATPPKPVECPIENFGGGPDPLGLTIVIGGLLFVLWMVLR